MRYRADIGRSIAAILGLAILVSAAYGWWETSQSRNIKIAQSLTAGDPSRAPVLIRPEFVLIHSMRGHVHLARWPLRC